MLHQHSSNWMAGRLAPFVGEWSMAAVFPSMPEGVTLPSGHTVFEWMAGEQFLVQRWEVPHPDAPDGLALIGPAPDGDYLQHYFDSRGVARLYQMTFDDGVWSMVRTAADFSPLDFCQRFTGTFSDDGKTIEGRWESSPDGTEWSLDFDLTYTRLKYWPS